MSIEPVVYHSIGVLHTPHKDAERTPIQPAFAQGCHGTAEIFSEFADGLRRVQRVRQGVPESCNRLPGACRGGMVRFADAVRAAHTRAVAARGGENSGRLVTHVRTTARHLAAQRNAELIITDGPPGHRLSCHRHTKRRVCRTHCDRAECRRCARSRAGAETGRAFWRARVRDCEQMGYQPAKTGEIEHMATTASAKLLPRIPYDTAVTEALVNAAPLVEISSGPAAKQIRKIRIQLNQLLAQINAGL